MKSLNVFVNGKFTAQQLTGVQRYANEVLSRLPTLSNISILCPGEPLQSYDLLRENSLFISKIKHTKSGIQRSFWEQVILPISFYQAKGENNIMFSPANIGPIGVSRQVVTIHDVAAMEHPEWFSRGFTLWYRFLYYFLIKKSLRIIAVSNFTKSRLTNLLTVDSSKIVVVSNGIDSRFSPASGVEKARAKKEFDISWKKYLLFVGSLEPRKNLSRLLQAWRRVQKQISPDVGLVVVGAKGPSEVFSDIGIDHIPARTQFLGYVDDEFLPGLYSEAYCFIYPSLYEGFGLPPLEAMACGTPVLTSNVTSLPEICGDAALLIDPYDVRSISDGIKKLVEDTTLRDQLIGKGLTRSKIFTWEKCAQHTLHVLQEAANSIE